MKNLMLDKLLQILPNFEQLDIVHARKANIVMMLSSCSASHSYSCIK